MTGLSSSHALGDDVGKRNRARSQRTARLAQWVHGPAAEVVRLLAVSSLSSLSACVIPPSLSVGTQDAAPNSPPVITAVRSDVEELKEPGPVVLDVGSTSSLSVELRDTDVNDKLYVRIFVDYDRPDVTPPRQDCPPVAAVGVEKRTATCPLLGVCNESDTQGEHYMTVLVSDREFVDSAPPAYQHVDDPNGLSTYRAFFLNCRLATVR